MDTWILDGLTALISGMSAVFMILILISVIISSLKHINKFEKKPTKQLQVATEQQASEPDTDTEEEQRRLVAAITVALALQLNVSADKLVIRKFRRV